MLYKCLEFKFVLDVYIVLKEALAQTLEALAQTLEALAQMLLDLKKATDQTKLNSVSANTSILIRENK